MAEVQTRELDSIRRAFRVNNTSPRGSVDENSSGAAATDYRREVGVNHSQDVRTSGPRDSCKKATRKRSSTKNLACMLLCFRQDREDDDEGTYDNTSTDNHTVDGSLAPDTEAHHNTRSSENVSFIISLLLIDYCD